MRLETTPWAPKILVLRVRPEKKKWNFSPLASTYAFRCPRTSRRFKKCLVSSYSCRNVQTMARLPRAQREPATLKSITRQAQMKREGGAGDHTAYLTHLQVRVPSCHRLCREPQSCMFKALIKAWTLQQSRL